MKKNKIAIFSLKKDTNIGDSIIGECVLYICKTIHPKMKFIHLDLKGRVEKGSFIFFILLPFLILKKINRIIKNDFAIDKLTKIIMNIYLSIYLHDCKLILFAGGGIIETSHYNCAFYISLITKFAEQRKIPIVYNSVGFNGDFEENNSEYQILKQCLNSTQVRYVTVRENLSEMINKYGINAKLVSDSAVWSSETYNITKENNSDIIGINIIRPGVFNEFGINFSKEQLFSYYLNLLNVLDEKDCKWELFTNGNPLDETFANEIIDNLNLPVIKKAERPLKGYDLLKILSKYKTVFCVRMHASICSYSLKIPTLALYWNPKQKFFYENTCNSESLVTIEFTDYNEIANKLINLSQKEWNMKKYNEYRNLVWDSLNNCLEGECKENE